MQKSESIASLAASLAKAQGEMENAAKNSTNPHFKSKYADLAEILNTVRPVLSKFGLAVTQFPAFEGNIASVETILTHESGEWMSGICSAPVKQADPQGVGSALTYLRRYSLSAVCGLAQEDDDANAASKDQKPAAQAPRQQQPQPAAPKAQPQRPAAQAKPVPATKATLEALASYYASDSAEVMLDDINEMLRKAAAHKGVNFEAIDQLTDLTEALAAWLIGQIESQLSKEAV